MKSIRDQINDLFCQITKEAVSMYEDGEVGIDRCVQLYCEKYSIDEITCEAIIRVYKIEAAVSYGIPRSVAEGKTKLKDHFSQDYIDYMCNRNQLTTKDKRSAENE